MDAKLKSWSEKVRPDVLKILTEADDDFLQVTDCLLTQMLDGIGKNKARLRADIDYGIVSEVWEMLGLGPIIFLKSYEPVANLFNEALGVVKTQREQIEQTVTVVQEMIQKWQAVPKNFETDLETFLDDPTDDHEPTWNTKLVDFDKLARFLGFHNQESTYVYVHEDSMRRRMYLTKTLAMVRAKTA